MYIKGIYICKRYTSRKNIIQGKDIYRREIYTKEYIHKRNIYIERYIYSKIQIWKDIYKDKNIEEIYIWKSYIYRVIYTLLDINLCYCNRV